MTTAGFTVIRGGRVLDAEAPAARRAEAADVLIEGETIREIGRPGLAAPEGATDIDAADRLLIPGLVNGHTHAHGALAKGMVEDRLPLEVFLVSAGALNGNRRLEDKYLTGLVSAVEMVRKGCTASFDMFTEFPLPTPEGVHAVARAYDDVGMRAVVAPMMADRTLYRARPGLMDALPEEFRARVEKIETAPHEESIAACRAIVESWPCDRARVRPAIAPTIPLHCSDEFLLACRDLAQEFDLGLQTHLAESKVQAVLGREKYGKTLTAHLDDLGLLGPGFSAAHAIWIDADDIRRLADAGASVSHNTMSNLRLGSGMAPARLMLDLGLNVAVGTDSTNTSDGQNLFEAARLAAYLSRVQQVDYGRWVSVEEAFAMATLGGARLLGFAGEIGRLAPGYKADVVFLDLGHINYVPLNDPLLQIVNGENGGAVDSVLIGGRLVLERGRMLTVDEAKLRADAEAAVARLNEANAANLELARAMEDVVGAFCIAQARKPYPAIRRCEDCGN